MGIASFILGIISFVLSFVPFLGFMMMLPAMVGFVLGIVGLVVKKETKKGFSITGIVLSSLAFFVMFISTIFFIPLIDNWVEDSENLSNLEIEVTDDTVDIEVTNDDSESIYEPSSVTTYVVSGKMSFDVPDELELFEEGLDVTTFYLNDNSFVIAEYASYEDVITYDDLYDYWEELYDVSVTTSINIIGKGKMSNNPEQSILVVDDDLLVRKVLKKYSNKDTSWDRIHLVIFLPCFQAKNH